MNRSLVIAIILTVLAVGWVLSGSRPAPASAPASDTAAQLQPEKFKVKVQTILAKPVTDSLFLQGQVEAAREIEIKAEVQGIVTRLGRDKGSRLNKGDLIVELDVSDRLARLKKAKADLDVKKSERDAGAQLQQKSMLSKNQQQQNIANVLAAEAAVKQIEVEIDKTLVRAPFATVLNDRYVEIGDYVSSGDPLVYLVDDSYVLISADVPQQYIARLAKGQTVNATLLDGRVVKGVISFISTSADPNTRTFRIEAKSENVKGIMRFGQSARVTIEMGEQKAHKLTGSLLDLDSEGVLQVKGVDQDNHVITQPVEIIRSERDGIWLKGLPDTFRVITVGQGFVATGDEVEPVEESASDSVTL
ncbi:efflux RND transporter periplasmic adaptor subunit [Alkalimarinus sediminis]|uniref:Efflux RND transporter periplasmic adaptor subunit n=1 Tax=Alkalimarinus sediminis TaxID=1632866 RepID=A0A9E8HFB1_9ALTE|nr:efflux RND transporter periplasmic adaptor subunit [Alkalimarinus sediminis]UZW73590.1 efflux RND transporter periplasmic adaptor subunit [Alkalimarinus sediminis]